MNGLVRGRMFVEAWLRAPGEVGAFLPSGALLADAMAAQVDPDAGTVIELGAGTGSVTRALLDRGIAPERLVSVEIEQKMVAALARRFPGVLVVQGDATRLGDLVKRLGVERPATVVSSLPLLSLRCWKRLRVLKSISELLPPGGRLVQFTYSPRCPVEPTLAHHLGFAGRRVRRVAFNLPPAAVWVYEKQVSVNSFRRGERR